MTVSCDLIEESFICFVFYCLNKLMLDVTVFWFVLCTIIAMLRYSSY